MNTTASCLSSLSWRSTVNGRQPRQGYLQLYDGARRHSDDWEVPGIAWTKGAGPCPREEAERRIKDQTHPWFHRGPLRRAETHKAMNALIQGSAARHTKLWMRACWREGIVPLLQMHDCLDCSVSSPEQAERVAQLGREAVSLLVPIQVDVKFGRNWADAEHSWEELHGNASNPQPVFTSAPISEKIESDKASIDLTSNTNSGGDDAHRQSDVQDARKLTATGTSIQAAIAPSLAKILSAADAAAPTLSEVNGHAPFKPAVILPTRAERRANGNIRCPFHDDKTPSLHLYEGHWLCFGCGKTGDYIDLLLMMNDSEHRAQAEYIIEAWNGRPDTQQQQPTNEGTLAFALQLWKQTWPIANTQAIRYLADVRGIDIDALPAGINEVLRFHPNCPFGPGTRVPCLIAVYRDVESDAFAGIHRIALTEDVLFNKGEVQRLALGSWPTPRAIKLWPAADQLFLGEGVETVLAAATRLSYRDAPMCPAWAAGSAGNVSKSPVVAGVEELILLVDYDPEGERCAYECGQTWYTAGRKVTQLRPERFGTDFNDVVLELLKQREGVPSSCAK